MLRCTLSPAAILVLVLLCAVLLAELPSSAALAESDHVSRKNTQPTWGKDATLHEKRLDETKHVGDDAGSKNVDEENEKVLKQSDRSHSYNCPNKCRPGRKGKKTAYYECKYSKCYLYHKYYKCVVKSCKYKYNHYYIYGWWCTCPYY